MPREPLFITVTTLATIKKIQIVIPGTFWGGLITHGELGPDPLHDTWP